MLCAMKISLIAARLRKVADNLEALAKREGDFDFPDEMVPKFVAVAFTDDDAVKSFTTGPRMADSKYDNVVLSR